MDVKRLIVSAIFAGLGAFLGALWLGSGWGAALGGGLGSVAGELVYRWMVKP